MTSMKKILAVVSMVLMMTAAVFAEGHKRQKIVVCLTDTASLASITSDFRSGKTVIKEPTMSKGDIPEGWHVVQMFVDTNSSSTAVVRIYLVLEEN
ncbi:MAG: hypothetical protein MJ159_02820 [Treponemataceae bacterium]|nr:hypothetical protein [Treponemataceae bacterium]